MVSDIVNSVVKGMTNCFNIFNPLLLLLLLLLLLSLLLLLLLLLLSSRGVQTCTVELRVKIMNFLLFVISWASFRIHSLKKVIWNSNCDK